MKAQAVNRLLRHEQPTRRRQVGLGNGDSYAVMVHHAAHRLQTATSQCTLDTCAEITDYQRPVHSNICATAALPRCVTLEQPVMFRVLSRRFASNMIPQSVTL